jgi:hypothetical protein
MTELMQDPFKNAPENRLDPDWCNEVIKFMDWLYTSSGRTCMTYTGLYRSYLETEAEIENR